MKNESDMAVRSHCGGCVGVRLGGKCVGTGDGHREPVKVEPTKVEPAINQVATAPNVAQPAASAASSEPSAAPPASRPDERSGMGLTWYVAIAVLFAVFTGVSSV